MTAADIPLIDLGDALLPGSGTNAEAARLLELPSERRAALDMRHSPTMRGFENLGAQTLDAAARPDLKESFYCGMRYPDDHPCVLAGLQTYGNNQWPEELPEGVAPPALERPIQAVRS